MALKMLKSTASRLVKLLLLAAPAITDFTCKFLQEDESNEEYLFSSVDKEDDGELQQNELVIYTDSD